MIVKGQRINDRYEIIGLLGEGGMANVYLANDVILNRKVAVKVLRGDLASDEKFIRRFQREALSASSLSHPNIVEMYDVGEEDGHYYIVMEYVEGITLKQLIQRNGPLTVPEVIDIMLQLTSGLACAHDAYIIHRDIKPQNILILDNGLVKITDFGVAMAMNNSQLTQTNSLLGSVHYLPPEQVGGKGSTMKSDIYSLGILMYELLVGKIPFSGENHVEIALKHMQDALPSVRSNNQKIPQSIENIILKAAAKNPKNRYNDIKEMQSDLESALTDERLEEAPYRYKYKEHDEEKVIEKTRKISPLATKIEDDDEESKNQKKKLKILGIVLGFLTLIFAFIFVIYPMLTEAPEIKVPDVSNLSVIEAEKILKARGFKVAPKTEKKANDTVEEGKVINTDPAIGRIIKKGTQITIIESTGPQSTLLKNYVGQNLDDIRDELETELGLILEINQKEVTLSEAKENNIILDQTPSAGADMKKGDKLVLTVSKVNSEIPDMVGEGWDVEMAEAFVDKNGIKLVVKEQPSSTVNEGLIISQSLKKGTKIVQGQTLTIYVAVNPAEEPVETTVN